MASIMRLDTIQSTTGNNAITINSNGVVNMQNKPIISGQIGSFSSFNGPTKVPFDDFWVQRGITYNSSTRRFTVPVTGIYRITMNPFFETGTGAARLFIGINDDAPNSVNHKGHAYREAATYDTVCIDSVVSLNASDYIVFYLNSGRIYNSTGDRFNQFSIEMIG